MANIAEILVLHHSHIDVGYTHSQPIFWELQHEFIDQAIDWLEATDGMAEGARPRWTCESSEIVKRWIERSTSSQVARFRTLLHAGRIGLSALRWNTTPLADRAGLMRLLDAKDWLEQRLETRITVACQHDVTGIPWPLTEVLLDAGVDFFVMAINIHLGRAVKPRPGMFLWETPSGRSIRVFNGHHYTMFDQLLLAWDDSVERMAAGWQAYATRLTELAYPFDFAYLTSTCSPIMWDNAPPNPFMPDLIRRWNEAGIGPRVRYATFDDLRQRALAVPDAQLTRVRGDWTDYWNFGCAASPIATARNQSAKPLVAAAERLGGNPRTIAQAREKIDLYDEHTCGYFDSNAEHPQAQTTELLKQALAHEGHELAAFSLMDAMECLAGNPVADKRVASVLLCNPDDHPISVHPELPDAWFTGVEPMTERTYRASRMFYDNRSWVPRFTNGETRAFGAIDLPPASWRIIALDQLPAATPTPGLRHHFESANVRRREANFSAMTAHHRRIGRIESPFHSMRYDADSGRILALTDSQSGRELIAPRKGIDFFSFIRERTDPLVEERRYAFYQRDLDREKVDGNCWQDWAPCREPASRVTACIMTERPGRITLERTFAAPGALFLRQRITFFAHDPVIQVDIDLELQPESSPQAIYFATALALPAGWLAEFDTAGTLVTVDDDQLPGACRNWVTTESLALLRHGERGVAIFTPDAPLVQFGDFHFHQPLDTLPRPENPLLLAWPVNNYWDTNFPRVQAGRLSLRYGFHSFANESSRKVQDVARAFRQPFLAWPVTTNGHRPGNGSLPTKIHPGLTRS